MNEITKEDPLTPTGFKIIVEEVKHSTNPNIGGWKAQDTGGRTAIKPTAEEAVAAVREMFWSMTKP